MFLRGQNIDSKSNKNLLVINILSNGTLDKLYLLEHEHDEEAI